MILNVRNSALRAKTLNEFKEDCMRIKLGKLPIRAMETDIYITRKCNMTCSYCYLKEYFDRDYQFKDPTLDELFSLIDKICEKTYGLVILGGEPLIRKDFKQIVRYAKQKEIPSVRIATNGFFIKQSLEALQYIDRVNISFDATRKREFPEQTEKILQDIKDVKKDMGKEFPKICIAYTLTVTDDFASNIIPVIKYAVSNGFDIKFLPCKYPNKEVNWQMLRTVLEEARKLIGDEHILNYVELAEQIDHNFLFANCLQGIQYYIDFEGYFLYPCDEYPNQRVGKIYDHSIDELYQMGQEMYGQYPNKNKDTCMRCKSYCHAENSYHYRYPTKQINCFTNE